ncbi:MAG: hypothetical protein RL220_1414 [Bacteroidota bacterium]
MKIFPQLSFPSIEPRIRESGAGLEVFDNIRRKWIRLTPEEWVRQHVVAFLINERGYPSGLIQLESGLKFHGLARRSDILCLDRFGNQLLLVECKAPEIEVNQSVMDQAARYNLTIGARYILLTNGIQLYCCDVDGGKVEYLSDVPRFRDM